MFRSFARTSNFAYRFNYSTVSLPFYSLSLSLSLSCLHVRNSWLTIGNARKTSIFRCFAFYLIFGTRSYFISSNVWVGQSCNAKAGNVNSIFKDGEFWAKFCHKIWSFFGKLVDLKITRLKTTLHRGAADFVRAGAHSHAGCLAINPVLSKTRSFHW